MLKKKDRIVASVSKCHPSVCEAGTVAMDVKNSNSLWADTISKEMENVRVAFEVVPDGKEAPIGH